MEGFSREVRDALSVFSGSLVVGNHDTITLHGARAQSDLRACSKKAASLMLADSEGPDEAIDEIVSEIEELGGSASADGACSKEALALIEASSARLKVRQAHLIREGRLMRGIEEKVSDAMREIEACIEEAEHVLAGREASGGLPGEAGWYSRLERRAHDLRTSHTLAAQTIAQLWILRECNLLAMDHVSGAISNLTVMAQNQVAIAQGIGLLRERTSGAGDGFCADEGRAQEPSC